MTIRPSETTSLPTLDHLPLERRALTRLLAQVLREWPGSLLELSRLSGWARGKSGMPSDGVSPIYLSNLQRCMVPATPSVLRKIAKTLRREGTRMIRLAERLERALESNNRHP